MNKSNSPRLLVVRRDNIGDLVLTTPLLRALRQRYPAAWIGVLVNSYNAPVLVGNPDVDEVFVYTKAKHRTSGQSLIGILWRRMQMMRRLRKMQLDEVILATPAPQPRGIALARWLKPRRIVGFGDLAGLDIALPVATEPISEAEDVFRIARLHGIEGPPPPCRIVRPDSMRLPTTTTVAVHTSARKPSQRWPIERFAEAMRQLHTSLGVHFVLLWSPGAANNRLHPGDDEKAQALTDMLGPAFPVTPVRTQTLEELIAALSGCHAMICGDGGASHLAAGLGLPVVCLFGNSDAARWRPWGVPYRQLKSANLDVAGIAVDSVTAAVSELLARTPAPNDAAPP